jgi:uncharacterized RDD family membrane protein YckC
MIDAEEFEYVGFWIRFAAAVVDSVLLLAIILPAVYAIYGPSYFDSGRLIAGPADFVLNWVLPAVAVIVFWLARQATPGKMVFGARIVDAESGAAPSTGQSIGRYFAYYVSMLPLFLGFLWVAFDPRKQGWHDKLARTVVMRPRRAARREKAD